MVSQKMAIGADANAHGVGGHCRRQVDSKKLCPLNVHHHVDKHMNNLAKPCKHWLGEGCLKNGHADAPWCAHQCRPLKPVVQRLFRRNRPVQTVLYRLELAPVTRQITSPTSSATSKECPSGPIATPTGRP